MAGAFLIDAGLNRKTDIANFSCLCYCVLVTDIIDDSRKEDLPCKRTEIIRTESRN